MGDVFSENGKGLPECEGFEGEDELRAGVFRHGFDERKIFPQARFFEEIVRSGHNSKKSVQTKRTLPERLPRTLEVTAVSDIIKEIHSGGVS